MSLHWDVIGRVGSYMLYVLTVLCRRWQLVLGAGISARDRMYLFNSVLHFYPPAHGISLDVPRTLAQSLLATMQKADVQTIAFPLAVCRAWIAHVFVVLV